MRLVWTAQGKKGKKRESWVKLMTKEHEMYLLVKIHCKFDRKEQLPCLSVYQTTMGAPNQAVSRWSDRCGNHISSE